MLRTGSERRFCNGHDRKLMVQLPTKPRSWVLDKMLHDNYHGLVEATNYLDVRNKAHKLFGFENCNGVSQFVNGLLLYAHF